MAHLLILGASGTLGRDALPILARRHTVVGASRRGGPGLEAVDIRDAAALEATVRRHQPDAVLLLAAYREPDVCETDPVEARRLNVEPARVLARCLPPACRLVFISSDYVFDGEQPPYREDSPRRPVSVYGQTKVEAEDLVAARPGSLIVRIPVLVGGGRTLADSGFIGQLHEAVISGRPQTVDDVLVRFPTWTRDVAHALDFLLERGASGIFHVSSLRGGTRYALNVELARLLGRPCDHLRPSRDVVVRKARRPRDSQLATDKIRALGYSRFTDFADVCRAVLGDLGTNFDGGHGGV